LGEQCLGVLQIGGVETFGEPVVNVGEHRARFVALALSVESVQQRHGQVLSWKGEPVTLGREYVATLRERRLSRGRIALLAGGSTLGLVVLVTAVKSLGFGSGGSGGGGPPR